MRVFPPSRPHLWAALGLVLVFVLLLSDLFLGRAAIPGDGDLFYGPYYMLVADFARAGRLLTWNPFSDGGLPDFVEPQSGAVSPLQLLCGLATGGTWAGYRLYLLAVWLGGGLGFGLLARHLGARAWEALVVALGFVFSGFFLGHATHIAFFYSFAWLPVVVLLLDRALEQRSRRLAAASGAAWGLSWLGGYPSVALGSAAVAVAWALARALSPEGAPRAEAKARWGWASVAIALLLVVGLAVASPVIVGLPYEAAGVSARAEPLPREAAVSSNYLEPLALTTLFSPYFQRLFSWDLWPLTDGTSCGLYPGALVLALGLAGLFGRPRALCLALGGVAVGALLVAVGPALPVRGWLYDFVPPTRYFRHAAVFRCFTVFALAVLAVLELRALRAPRPRKSWGLFGSAALCALLALWSFQRVTAVVTDDRLAFARAHAVIAWSGTLGAGLLVALTAAPWRARVLALALPVLALLDAGAAERLGAWHKTRAEEWVYTWSALARKHSTELDLAKTTGLDRQLKATRARGFGIEPSNRNFVTKQPVLVGYTGFLSAFQRAWTSDPLLQYAAVGPQRLWFAEETATVAPDMEAFDAFLARAHALGTLPLVLHERASLLIYPPAPVTTEELALLSAVPAAVRQPYQLLKYEPAQLELEVEVARPGWLLVTDRWARGWRARVNGAAVEVRPANFLYRAVPVSAGRNRVQMSYEPATLPWTLTLSWGTLAVVAGLAWAGRRRREEGRTHAA